MHATIDDDDDGNSSNKSNNFMTFSYLSMRRNKGLDGVSPFPLFCLLTCCSLRPCFLNLRRRCRPFSSFFPAAFSLFASHLSCFQVLLIKVKVKASCDLNQEKRAKGLQQTRRRSTQQLHCFCPRSFFFVCSALRGGEDDDNKCWRRR